MVNPNPVELGLEKSMCATVLPESYWGVVATYDLFADRDGVRMHEVKGRVADFVATMLSFDPHVEVDPSSVQIKIEHDARRSNVAKVMVCSVFEGTPAKAPEGQDVSYTWHSGHRYTFPEA